MPTCAADSWVDSSRSEASTGRARLVAGVDGLLHRGRSSATNENSAATKTAVPTVSATPSRTSNHSVIVVPSPRGPAGPVPDHGRGTTRRTGPLPPDPATPPSRPAPSPECGCRSPGVGMVG